MKLGLQRRILSWIWPERCAFCGTVIAAGTNRCNACAAAVREQERPLCLMCGQSKRCCVCHGKGHTVDGTVTAYVFDGPVRQAVHRMKQGKLQTIEMAYLVEQLAQAVQREWPDMPWSAITFVPRTRREKERGAHVSRELAESMAKLWRLPCEELLIKVRETRPQKQLTALERGANLRGTLDVPPQASVKGRTVLLVDDVATTGATLRECALMLKIYGAKAVYAAALAKTSLEEKGQ